MKKRFIVFLLVTFFLSIALPFPAIAASGTISSSGSRDLNEFGDDSTITINPGLTVTLTNTTGNTYSNLQIDCGSGVNLTLDSVKISNTDDYSCALAFDGFNNKLILSGVSYLKSGCFAPGIKVEGSTSLEISGSGELEVLGDDYGAGIGAGYYKPTDEGYKCGNIKIISGEKAAQ